jgi:hypothetical protein
MALKVTGIIVGAVIALAGLITGGAGGALFATIGSDGKVSSGQQTFDTPGAALVTSAADLRGVAAIADVVGDPRVRLSLDTSKPGSGVFVGVGPAKDVERYLAGAPIDEVKDLEVSPFKLEHHPRSGTRRLAPPGTQSFWTAQATGADHADFDWKATSGNYRVVVMNADGSRGVRTHGDASVAIPHTAPIAWSLIGGGLLLLIGGIGTIALAMRQRDPLGVPAVSVPASAP